MQSFKLGFAFDMTAVITKNFLEEARKEATAPEATVFLKTIQAKYPEDDDQFMMAIVKNAVRTSVRLQLIDFMMGSGVGGTVSPVQIVSESITQPRSAVEDFAKATDPDAQAEQGALATRVEQVRIEKESPGVLVQGLQESRDETGLRWHGGRA